MSGRVWGRVVFYGLVLTGLGAVGGWFWWNSVPQHVERALADMRHPNAQVAAAAWLDLRQLYLTKWAAVDLVLAAAEDSHSISFLVEPIEIPVAGKSSRDAFWAHGKPWYYKTDRIHCRTVGESIRAFFYQEVDGRGRPKWRHAYDGDWDAWWIANRGYYGI